MLTTRPGASPAVVVADRTERPVGPPKAAIDERDERRYGRRGAWRRL